MLLEFTTSPDVSEAFALTRANRPSVHTLTLSVLLGNSKANGSPPSWKVKPLRTGRRDVSNVLCILSYKINHLKMETSLPTMQCCIYDTTSTTWRLRTLTLWNTVCFVPAHVMSTPWCVSRYHSYVSPASREQEVMSLNGKKNAAFCF